MVYSAIISQPPCNQGLTFKFQDDFFQNTILPLANKIQDLAPFKMEKNQAIIFSEEINCTTPATSFPSSHTIQWNRSYIKKNNCDIFSQVFALIFERMNTLHEKEFTDLNNLARNQKIDKEKYVESVERIEYQNALATQKLMLEGIKKSFLEKPEKNYHVIFPDFSTHYQYQQLTGHSQKIAARYDEISSTSFPYKGTFPLAFEALTQEQYDFILALFFHKMNRETDNEETKKLKIELGCNLIFYEYFPISETRMDEIKFKAIKCIFSKNDLLELKKIGQEFLNLERVL